MIKTPLSTVIGGVGMYTKNSLIIGSVSNSEPVFDPASLFENGEIGTLLDATDLNRAYKSSTLSGSISSGDTLMCLVDKSSMLMINTPISNSNFEDGLIGVKVDNSESVSTWGLNTNDSISGLQDGRLIVTTASNSRPSITFESSMKIAGQVYELSFDYKVNSGVFYVLGVYDGADSSRHNLILSGTGRAHLRYMVRSNNSREVLYVGRSLCDVQIDNITVHRLAGNHTYQVDAAKRPTLQNDVKFDSVDDALNIAFPNALINCTIFTVKHGGQAQILDAQSVAQNHVINQDFKYYGIVNRALTSAERADLTRFLNKLGAQ